MLSYSLLCTPNCSVYFFPPLTSSSTTKFIPTYATFSNCLLSLGSVEDINRSVVPEGVQLSTERRAKERQEFDRIICEKEALRARVEEQHRMEQEERQKAEIAAMRQDQVTENLGLDIIMGPKCGLCCE